MSRLLRSITIASFVFFAISGSGFSQIRSHEIGRLWESFFPTEALPEYAPAQNQMTYPAGDFNSQRNKNLEARGLWIGVSNWTDKDGIFHAKYVSENGILTFDSPVYTTKISNQKFFRNRLPTVRVNGQQEQRILDSRSGTGIRRRSSLVSDEMIETKWATNVGIQVTRRSYAFANRNHDSYIIMEYTFTNNGSIDENPSDSELGNQNLEGVYFAWLYSAIPSGDRGNQQVRERDEWAHYYGNQPGDTLRGLWYVYDGDAQAKVSDDVGDPDQNTGEFLATQYVGFGVLHADAAYDNEADNRSQPSTVTFVPRSNLKTHGAFTDEDLYLEISSGEQSQGTDTGEYQRPTNPAIQAPVVYLSFGPYDIPFGESVRIVLYEAIGSISRAQAIQAGQDWRNGTLSYNGLSGDEAKNALIATGKDSLFMFASHAEWAWEHGLDIPDPPVAPRVELSSGPGKIILSWEAVHEKPDNDTGQLDFAGYRIYRTESSIVNEYKLIWDSGETENPDTTLYEDRDVERGRSYYYAITAYDDGSQNTAGLFPGQSLESSFFYNRNYQFAAVPFLGARKDLDSVYVVPNPYHAHGFAFGGRPNDIYYIEDREVRDQIAFVGLPAKARIKIFTTHGDLVAVLEHPDPNNPLSVPDSADEAWFQISDSYQIIKSGVYFYFVEGWNFKGEFLGTTSGKFVVIR